MKGALVLSPHTDDAELGAGATIHRLVHSGWDVRIAAFSTGNSDTGSTVDEFNAAMAQLGVTHCGVGDFPARNYRQHRQAILDLLISMRDGIRPKLVLFPALSDIHQDHETIAAEAMRAFKGTGTTLLGYELPANTLRAWEGRVFMPVDEVDVYAKLAAIECYESQADRPYVARDFLLSLAMVRGLQIRTKFAEAFEVVRMVL